MALQEALPGSLKLGHHWHGIDGEDMAVLGDEVDKAGKG